MTPQAHFRAGSASVSPPRPRPANGSHNGQPPDMPRRCKSARAAPPSPSTQLQSGHHSSSSTGGASAKNNRRDGVPRATSSSSAASVNSSASRRNARAGAGEEGPTVERVAGSALLGLAEKLVALDREAYLGHLTVLLGRIYSEETLGEVAIGGAKSTLTAPNIQWILRYIREFVWWEGKEYAPGPDPTPEEEKEAYEEGRANLKRFVRSLPFPSALLLTPTVLDHVFEFLQIELILKHAMFGGLEDILLELFPELKKQLKAVPGPDEKQRADGNRKPLQFLPRSGVKGKNHQGHHSSVTSQLSNTTGSSFSSNGTRNTRVNSRPPPAAPRPETPEVEARRRPGSVSS